MIPATCCGVRSMLGAGCGGLGVTLQRQLIRYNLTQARGETSRLLRCVAPNLHSQPQTIHHHHNVRSLHATAIVRSDASSSSSSSSEPPPPPTTDSMPPIQWTTHRLSQESIEKTDRIFHKILWLDFVETSELTVAMNQRLKLKLTPQQDQQLFKAVDAFDRDYAGVGVSGSDSDATTSDATAAEVGPVLVDVKLQGFDAKAKIKVIKEVRALTELGLKEAKELVEAAPTVVLKGLKPEAAAEIKAKLEGAGAQVELA